MRCSAVASLSRLVTSFFCSSVNLLYAVLAPCISSAVLSFVRASIMSATVFAAALSLATRISFSALTNFVSCSSVTCFLTNADKASYAVRAATTFASSAIVKAPVSNAFKASVNALRASAFACASKKPYTKNTYPLPLFISAPFT